MSFSATWVIFKRNTIPNALQLKTLNDEIDKLTKDLQTQEHQLSDDRPQTRTRTIDEKKQQLDRGAAEIAPGRLHVPLRKI